MNEREAFEAEWGDASVLEREAWEIWQAATQIERERCAKIAERHYIPGHSIAGPGFAADCAAAIRKGEKT